MQKTILQLLIGIGYMQLISFLGFSRVYGQSDDDLSTIVYPIQKPAIRVNHLHPQHHLLSCTRCHSKARDSQNQQDLLTPSKSTCIPCHRDRMNKELSTTDTCGYCHYGFDPEKPMVIPLLSIPTARLHFSHAVHMRSNTSCTDCHKGIRQSENQIKRHLPSMRRCGTCHDVYQGKDCGICHVSYPSGLLQTHFAEARLVPPNWFLGMRHDSEWTVRHRWIGADHGDVCAACHKERQCTQCHDGRVRPSSVHPNDWLTLHPQRARRNQPHCTSCHTTQTFCSECHARLGVAFHSSPNIRSAHRIHPPSNTWISGPNRHAQEARRSLSSCISCHGEGDCVTCHGSQGIGLGISPHPKGFSSKCGSLLRRNTRACRVCHRRIDQLLDRCLK